MAANYDSRDPFKLENGQYFNYGAPGSKTEAINKNNPEASLDKPYVQEGDTGGYLVGKGVTIGEGRSITPQEEASNRQQFLDAGYSESQYNDFMARNPGDSNRALEGQTNSTDGGSNGGSSVAQQWNSALGGKADDFYSQLLARSQQSLAVDRNDPIIRAQSDAFGAQGERYRREYLNDQAEKVGPLANIQGESRLSAERLGQQTGAFEAELMGRELTARRDEISQALTLMAGRLTTEQTLALQRELGLIDAQLQSRGLDQSNDQFLRQLALQAWISGDNSQLNWAKLGA